MTIHQSLNSKQLREIPVGQAEDLASGLKRQPLYFILENIYDTYNIGGLFRLADALAVEKIYLCGETETPPNHKIQKASVGTHKIVPWEYSPSAIEVIEEIRVTCNVQRKTLNIEKDTSHATRYTLQVYAIEQSKTSVPYHDVDYSLPLALLVGNETYGVTPETLRAVDKVVEIPMWGINKSLNVIVSAAVVGYHAMGVKRITYNV